MDYLKNVNIKKDINPIFFHGIFFKIVHPSKSPAWSGNSKSLKKVKSDRGIFGKLILHASVFYVQSSCTSKDWKLSKSAEITLNEQNWTTGSGQSSDSYIHWMETSNPAGQYLHKYMHTRHVL